MTIQQPQGPQQPLAPQTVSTARNAIGIGCMSSICLFGMFSWILGARDEQQRIVAQQRAPEAPQTVSPPPPSAPRCDARQVPAARLRQRGTAAECMGRAIAVLRASVGEGNYRILGWSAEESNDGPPCWATFAYDERNMRRSMRFAFFPGPPAYVATADEDTDAVGDLCDTLMHGGATVSPTPAQLETASLVRLGGRRFNIDAFVDPREANTITVLRAHCEARMIAIGDNPTLLRTMRNSGIRRYKCIGDTTWVLDIPPRGRVGDPQLIAN